MGSSKKKSSFRIDDLLQHHTADPADTHAHLKRQMFAPVTSATSAQPNRNRSAPISSATTITPTAPNFHRMVKEMLEIPNINHHHHNEQITSTSHAAHASNTAAKSSAMSQHSSSPYADLPPHKPMPMYAPPSTGSLLDMSKQPNYCFPMPMAMTPPFSHAATAYLEHYANTFHKGQCTNFGPARGELDNNKARNDQSILHIVSKTELIKC